MATAEQLKSLIRSHLGDEREQFVTIALQLAAHEANQGHRALAHEIRAIIDKAKPTQGKVIPFRRELSDLVISVESRKRLQDLIVSSNMRSRISRILQEYRKQEKIKSYGLDNRRKLLLAGPPGTGKTMTAAVLAGELRLPLHTILMDKLVTKFMGETSAKLRQVFDLVKKERGVYLFDEFDAIGGERGRDDDVGEMRRVLNSFLQFMEQDDSLSLIVAATNNPRILDRALFRRFDDVLYYQLPNEDEIKSIIENRLAQFLNKGFSSKKVMKESESLSHAEITQACNDAIKDLILSDRKTITVSVLKRMLDERRSAYGERKR